MKKIILLLIIFVVSCNERYVGGVLETLVCKDKTMKSRRTFILKCIKNANPKSDEDPEDWIMLCNTMALDIYCKTKTQHSFKLITYSGESLSPWIDRSKAKLVRQKKVCGL